MYIYIVLGNMVAQSGSIVASEQRRSLGRVLAESEGLSVWSLSANPETVLKVPIRTDF